MIQQANPEVVYVPSLQPYGGIRPAGVSLPAHLLSSLSDITPPAWRSRSVLVLLWERHGVVAGAMVAAGATTTSTSTSTTTLIATPTLMAATACRSQPATSQRKYGQQVAAQSAAPRRRPYSDSSTAKKYGGTARGDSMSGRRENAPPKPVPGRK